MTPAKAKQQPVGLVRSGPSGGIMAVERTWQAARARRPDRLRHGRHKLRGVPAAGRRADVHESGGARVRRPDRADDGRRASDRRGRRLAWRGSTRPGSSRSVRRAPAPTPGRPATGAAATQATVTDANLILGRLSPTFLLAGDLALEVDAAARALDPLAAQLGLSASASRRGSSTWRTRTWRRHSAWSRPTAATTRAARRSSPTAAPARCTPASSRGRSRSAGARPRYPGAFSAFGALLADTRFDYTQTAMDADARSWTSSPPTSVFRRLERRARGGLPPRGLRARRRGSCARSICATSGQNWELDVPMPGGELTRGATSPAAAPVRGRARALLRVLDPRRGARDADVQRRGGRHPAYDRASAARAGPAARADRAPRRHLPGGRRAGRDRRLPPGRLFRRAPRSRGPPWSARSTRRRCFLPAAPAASTSTATC